MEKIEIINIDFSGYMECDKNDIVLNTINGEGKFEPVNVHELTSDEIVQGVRDGLYHISFRETYSKQLDGQIEFTLEKDI